MIFSYFSILFIFEMEVIEDGKKILINQQEEYVKLKSEVVSSKMELILSDLIYLKEVMRLQIDKDNDLRDIEKVWVIFSENRNIYDQIRFIDMNGNEKLRIDNNNNNDGKAVIVNENHFQNKSERYYFKDTINLGKDDIYISKFDLNIEKSEIEMPVKPMLRISTPFYDNNDELIGIIIINYLGENIIKSLKQFDDENSNLSLVNSSGYWLYNDDETKCWAFMYDERKDINFKELYFDEWNSIINDNDNDNNINSIITVNGFFAYKKVDIKFINEKNFNGKIVLNEDKWIIISHIELDNPNSYYTNLDKIQIIETILKNNYFNFILLIIISFIFALLINRIRNSYEKITKLSMVDGFSGAYNRRTGLNILNKKIARMNKDDNLSICFADIDGLKRVNDTLGHEQGDQLILDFVKCVGLVIRNSDLLIRFGGDEFLIILDKVSKEKAEIIWERVKDEIKISNDTLNRKYLLSVSHGIVDYLEEPNLSINELIEISDRRMYEEKEKKK